MKPFCLLSYEDPEVSIPLFDDKVRGGSSNVTVVIGPNGSGKSRVLSRVVDELQYIHALRASEKTSLSRVRPPSEVAKLRYRINGYECAISRRGSDVDCTINGEWSELSDLPFPKKVATVSHLPTDKFRFLRGEVSDFYRYLGLRQATNLTTTGALETKVIQSLLVGFTKENFSQKLDAWLSLAGMSSEMSLAIALDNESLLTTDFRAFQESIWEIAARRKGAARAISEKLNKRWTNDHDNVWLLFSRLRDLRWTLNGRHPSCAYQLKHLISSPDDAQMWLEGYDAARRLRLFREFSLLLGKPGGKYLFSSLSSGEQQLIGTNARLLAELDAQSLVIIDEPEVSLHPDWQIKYIPTLLKSFRGVSAAHIIVATHSHFMVSDLDYGSSALVVSSYENGPKFSLFDGDVYGRSPENILYRVFGVATAGNSYVEGDLYSALRMLSKAEPTDLTELKAIYHRLERVRGKDNAAMNVILEQIRGVLEVVI